MADKVPETWNATHPDLFKLGDDATIADSIYKMHDAYVNEQMLKSTNESQIST